MILSKQDIVRMIEVYKKCSLIIAEGMVNREEKKLLKTFVLNFDTSMKKHRVQNKDFFNWSHVDILKFNEDKLNIEIDPMKVCCRLYESVLDVLFNKNHPCGHLKIGINVEGVVVE